jgi:hypothetical protein
LVSEYHANIQWVSVPVRCFRITMQTGEIEAHDMILCIILLPPLSAHDMILCIYVIAAAVVVAAIAVELVLSPPCPCLS